MARISRYPGHDGCPDVLPDRPVIDAVRRRVSGPSRGVVAIIGGTGGAQLALLASAPIISRLYSPADVGMFSVVAALAMTVGAVAALRFELAIPLPPQDRDAYSLAVLGFGSTVAVTIAGLCVVPVVNGWAAVTFGQPALAGWLYAVPVIAAVIGGFSVLNQLALRQRRYTAVARRNLLQGVTMAAVQVAAGVAGARAGGMIAGLGVGQAAGMLSLTRGAGLGSPDARTARTYDNLRAVFARYRRFPTVLAPSGLLNILGLQLPILLIAWLHGGDVAGWLGMTQRILALPMSLVGLAVGQVFLAEMSRAAREDTGQARTLFVGASKRLAVFAGAVFVVLVVAGPPLFSVVLGEQWQQSGVYAQALAAALAMQLLASPLSQTLIVYERQWLQLGWDAGRMAAVVAAILIADQYGSPVVTVWAFGLTSAVAYAVSWWLSYRTVVRSRSHNRV